MGPSGYELGLILAVEFVVSSEFPVGRGDKPCYEKDSDDPESHRLEVKLRQPAPIGPIQVQLASKNLQELDSTNRKSDGDRNDRDRQVVVDFPNGSQKSPT